MCSSDSNIIKHSLIKYEIKIIIKNTKLLNLKRERREKQKKLFNKYMRKILITTVLVVMIISAFYNCFAFDIGKKELISLGECELYLRYMGNDKRTNYVVYQKDGKQYPAYCLNSELKGVGADGIGNYAVNVDSKLTDVNIWRVIINGFPYKSIAELGTDNEHEAFTATKFAIYTIIHNRNPKDYSPVDTDAGRRTYNAYLKIVNAAQNSTETLEQNVQVSIIPDKSNWEVDNIEKDSVSKTYSLISKVTNGECTVEFEGELPEGVKITDENNNIKNNFKIGEKVKIVIPIKSLNKTDKFTIKASANVQSKPVLYGKTTILGTQNYAIAGYMYEEKDTKYIESYQENITKIKVIKKEEQTEKRLSGVKFNLLDANKEILFDDLVTNENGEIIIEDILPGKYYLQETETLNGYNLYTDLIEVNLKLNEEINVTVNNSLTSVTNIDNPIENIEITSKAEEVVYTEENVSTVKNITNKKLPVTGY